MKNITFDKNTVRIHGRPRLSGEVYCPSSKSAAHRELIAAALSDGPSVLFCRGISKDIRATADCLSALGADIRIDNDLIRVSPIREPVCKATLNCNESGTTLRFMIPLAAFLGVDTTFVCAPGLARRPISVLCDELTRHGVTFPDGYSFPLRMNGKALGGEWRIRGDISSQFISGILLALPLSDIPSTLEVVGRCESLPYINITVGVMLSRGISISGSGSVYSVNTGKYSSVGSEALPHLIESDWSSAAFWLAAGLSSDEGITVHGLKCDSCQGDKAILPLLISAGARIESSDEKIKIRKSSLHSFDCDCSQTPDMVPVLSVCAAIADGESKIRGIERLRLKESDRIESTMAMLTSLGISSSYSDGIMTVCGGKIRKASVNGYNDHRIVMSAAVASCFTDEEIEISDAFAVEKSYPSFFDHFISLTKD